MGPEVWFVAPAGSAAVAAVVAWLSGLSLERAADDPTLAERFHSHRVRLTFAVALCAVAPLIALQYAGGMGMGPWLVPGAFGSLLIAALGATAGGYPLRRSLSGEGNSFPVYVVRSARALMAMFGFWIGVALLPYIVQAVGAVAAASGCALLLVWSRNHPRFVCAILGVEPLQEPAFERITDRSPAQRPGVYSFGSDRGSLVNAFALPSLRDPRILMSRPLLRDLSPAESAAVFAHELAHHEDFQPETLRRWGWQERAFIVVGALGPLVLPPAWIPYLLWSWPVLLLVVLGRRASGMQDRERYSDNRAVELCGDTEAYIRALEKIHAANHLPRRLAGDAEKHASHPSLARRIAALRGDPEADPMEMNADGIYESRSKAGLSLHIEQGTLCWIREDDGERTTRVPVAELVELRLLPRRGGPVLRAVERGGTKHKFDVRAEDVARLHEALDRLDGQLARLPKASPWESIAQLAAPLVALMALLAAVQGAFSIMSGLMLAVAGLSIARKRTRAGTAAVGAMALYLFAQSQLLAFDRSWWSELAWVGILVTGVGGALLLAIAARAPLEPGRTPRIWIVIGVLAWSTMLLTLIHGDLGFRLHVLGRTSPALFLPWIAAGAALLSLRRWIGALALVLGLSGLLCGTAWFWQTATDDPLAVEAPACTIESRTYSALVSVDVPHAFFKPLLSPGATRFMARSDERIIVGDFASVRHEFEARDAAFVDDERVLRLIDTTAGFRLELVRWDAPANVLWSLPLDGWELAGNVELSLRGDRWEIFAGRHLFVSARLRGRLGTTEAKYRSWVTDDGRIGDRFAEIDGALLESGVVPAGQLPGLGPLSGLLQGVYETSGLRRIENDSYATDWRTAALLGARAPAEPNGEVLCVSYAPGGAALWTYDARKRRLTPRARVEPCRAFVWDGRQVAVLQPRSVALVDLGTRTMTSARLPDDAGWGTQLALADGRVLVGRWTADGLTLDLLDLR